MTVLVGVFNSDGVVECYLIDFEGVATALPALFVETGPFGPRQVATIEPLLSQFRRDDRHAGLGGGLMLRMVARIWPKMLRGTATSAS